MIFQQSRLSYCIIVTSVLLSMKTTSISSTTFKVCDKTPQKYLEVSKSSARGTKDEFADLISFKSNNCTEILQASFISPNKTVSNYVSPYLDLSLVHTVVECYNGHHNLILRPDDIWAAIMTQFSFYINKHSEEFRKQFVSHKGKKKLTVVIPGTLRDAPYDAFVKGMSAEIHKNLVDAKVKKWVLPNFSTTTESDVVVVGVIFMAIMKKYFDYEAALLCGIPSITLEGSVADWKNIRGRLEKLKEYKLNKWYDMLEPILEEFVKAKEGKVDFEFWGRIAHYDEGGSGPSWISGWITAFSVFDKDGEWIGNVPRWDPWTKMPSDNMRWPVIETNKIPKGVVEVDVLITEGSKEYDSALFSGHLGVHVKNEKTTLQPMLAWAMCLKGERRKRKSTQ